VGRRCDDAGVDAVLAAALPPVRTAAAHQVAAVPSLAGAPHIHAARPAATIRISDAALVEQAVRHIGNPAAGPPEATAGDFFALLKPRVMSLVVFTAFVGLSPRRATSIPWLGGRRHPLHRGRRRRVRRAQHVVRRRHRRRDARTASARFPPGASPGEALAFGLRSPPSRC
jgi:hypothetical protein